MSNDKQIHATEGIDPTTKTIKVASLHLNLAIIVEKMVRKIVVFLQNTTDWSADFFSRNVCRNSPVFARVLQKCCRILQ